MTEPRRLAMSAATVGAVGVAATAVVALIVREPSGATLQLSLLSGGVALAAGALGAAVTWLLRRRPLGVQVLVVALTAIAAVGAGSWAAARAMYVSRGDLSALTVILVASGTGAAVVAVLVAERFRGESEALVERTRGLTDDGRGTRPDMPRTRELATVARSLDHAQERLREARDRQARLEESRRRLVADMSHDLRTPMAKIRALTEALEDGVIRREDAVAAAYRTLGREMDRLTGLVDDLFELSRAQAQLPLEREEVPLAAVVSDAVASARPLAESREVELAAHGSDTPTVEASTRDLSRVLDNLLSNAIRHTPPGGEVVVSSEADRGAAVVHVDDECGGIGEADLPHLFEVAYTGDRVRDPNPEPSGGGPRAGLGLAIARGLVEMYDGTLTAANHGAGCRFTVRIPAGRREPSAATEPSD